MADLPPGFRWLEGMRVRPILAGGSVEAVAGTVVGFIGPMPVVYWPDLRDTRAHHPTEHLCPDWTDPLTALGLLVLVRKAQGVGDKWAITTTFNAVTLKWGVLAVEARSRTGARRPFTRRCSTPCAPPCRGACRMRPSPSVLVQQIGPETWRIHVPGRYLTTAEGPLERDAALTIASRHARQRYADGYPGDRSEWRSDTD